MIVAAVVTLALAQCLPYTRTKVLDSDPESHSLYWREKTTIEWSMNAQGNPETTGDTEFTAAEKAFGTWQTQLAACSSLNFREGPRTNTRLAVYLDPPGGNENVVLWRFKKCGEVVNPSDACFKDESCGNKFDCWDHNAAALAITTTSFDPMTGRILDADIELNTPGFLFTTVDAPPCVKPAYSQSCVASDVQNTLTHEVGHLLGLAHSCFSDSTMFASAIPGEISKRQLDANSKQFICDTYPPNGPSSSGVLLALSDCADAGCTPVVLGKGRTGCAAAPGGWWAAAALLGLLARRRG